MIKLSTLHFSHKITDLAHCALRVIQIQFEITAPGDCHEMDRWSERGRGTLKLLICDSEKICILLLLPKQQCTLWLPALNHPEECSLISLPTVRTTTTECHMPINMAGGAIFLSKGLQRIKDTKKQVWPLLNKFYSLHFIRRNQRP